jgi:hypothetical protein
MSSEEATSDEEENDEAAVVAKLVRDARRLMMLNREPATGFDSIRENLKQILRDDRFEYRQPVGILSRQKREKRRSILQTTNWSPFWSMRFFQVACVR